MDKEQRKELFETLVPKVEAQERDRGLSDEEIAANRQKLTQMLAEEGDRTNPYFGDLEQTVETGVPPAFVKQFQGNWILRLAMHPMLVRAIVVGFSALYGYWGFPTHGHRLWDPGARGVLYGAGFGLGVLVLAQISLIRSRRRKTGA